MKKFLSLAVIFSLLCGTTYTYAAIYNPANLESYESTITAVDVAVSDNALASSTYSSLGDFFKLYGSAGEISGGVISDNGDNTVAVTAGTGLIRSADSDTAQLYFFDWAASSSIPVAADSEVYIGVEYNGGSPRIVSKATYDWDLDTEFPLAVAHRYGSTMHVSDTRWHVGDAITNVIERFNSTGIERDGRIGGLITSVPGTRNIAVTAGSLLNNLNEYTVNALDTSVSGSFKTYRQDGLGGWVNATSTQYGNTQYDNAGTLTAMTASYYANWWVFAETDGHISLLYPQAEYSSAAAAEAGSVPTTMPDTLDDTALLIGRIVFQNGVDAPVSVQDSFGTTFTGGVSSSHANLSNLQGGGTGEYYHLNLADYTGTGTGILVRATSSTMSGVTLQGDNTIANASTTNETVSGYLDVSGDTTLANATATNVHVSGNSSFIGLVDSLIGYMIGGNTVLNASTTNKSTLVGDGAGASLLADGLNTTAIGYQALNAVTSANDNTAVGTQSMFTNTTGYGNAAYGIYSMYENITGYYNTAIGRNALYTNRDGIHNTALGLNAGRFLNDGVSAASTTDFSVFLGSGASALTSNDQNSIVIGYNTHGLGSNSVVLGNDSITTTALKGNVGIGTTTPANTLVVAGDSLFTATSTFAGSLALSGTASNIALGSNWLSGDGDDEGVYVDASGNVGIGTATPSTALHIYGGDITVDRGANTQSYTSTLSLGGARNTSGNDIATLNFYNYDDNNSATDYVAASIASRNHFGTDDGNLRFSLAKDTVLSLAMLISEDGDVGIGGDEVTPDFKLEIASSTANGYFGISSTEAGDGNILTVDVSGNVGIGTTTPANKLAVHDGSIGISQTGLAHGMTTLEATTVGGSLTIPDTSGGLNIKGISSAATRYGTQIDGIVGNASPTVPGVRIRGGKVNGTGWQAMGNSELLFDVQNYTSSVLSILGNGNVGIGTTTPTRAKLVVEGDVSFDNGSYGYLSSSGTTGTAAGTVNTSIYSSARMVASEFNAISDERVKTNITNIPNALDSVMGLNIVAYNKLIKDGSAMGELGVLGQEVAETFPLAVRVSEGEVPTDNGGWKLVNDFHSVNYQTLSMLGLQAVQELKHYVDMLFSWNEDQDARLDALEEHIKVLEAENARLREVINH